MSQEKNNDKYSIYAILTKIKKHNITKLWLGIAKNEKEAMDKIEREFIFDLLPEYKFFKKSDIKKILSCNIDLNNVMSTYKNDNKEDKKIIIKKNNKKLTKNEKKNELMKRIIEEKNKKLFYRNKEKFNKNERLYLSSKIK